MGMVTFIPPPIIALLILVYLSSGNWIPSKVRNEKIIILRIIGREVSWRGRRNELNDLKN